MRQATQDAATVLFQNDPTVDNRLIGPALDVLKGKVMPKELANDECRVVSRRQAADLLVISPRVLDDLGRRGKVKRVYLTEKGRATGYLLASLRQYVQSKTAE